MISNSMRDMVKSASILLFLSLLFFRMPLLKVLPFESASPLVIIILACILYCLSMVGEKILVSKKTMIYAVFLLCLAVLSFYKNPAIEDSKNLVSLVQYPIVLFYACVVSVSKKSVNLERTIIRFFKYLAIISSAFTLLSIIFPSTYFVIIKTIMPLDTYNDILKMQLNNNAYAGIMHHYTSNAFVTVLGIFAFIYDYRQSPKKQTLATLFLIVMLLMIGKRAHLIFVLFVIIAAYLLWQKIKIKTIMKLVFGIVAVIGIGCLIITQIPQASNTINRFMDSGVSGDITTGRSRLYERAFEYREREGGPLGWGKFSKMTDYKYAGLHNDYLQFYIELGVIPAVLIASGDILILINAVHGGRTDRMCLFAFMISLFFILLSFVEVPHFSSVCYSVFFIVNSCTLNRRLGDKKKEKNNAKRDDA